MRRLMLCIILVLAFVATAKSGEIHQAALAGDLATVQTLLSATPLLLEEKDEQGRTPLLEAASAGKLEIVQYLMEKGADLRAATPRGTTALNLAAYAGHLPVVTFLLDKGCDVNTTNSLGYTPLLYACAQEGHADMVQLLLEHGANISVQDSQWGGAPMHHACRFASDELRNILLAHGADLRTRSYKDSSSPLIWAVYQGIVPAIEFMVDHGVDLNAPGERTAPLIMAIYGRNPEIARVLIDKGARLDISEEGGMTPLAIAAQMGDTSMVTLFVSRGADVNKLDRVGRSPLHYGAFAGNLPIESLLLSRGAQVNVSDSFGETPLACAVQSGQMMVVELLINKGAKINTVNQEGQTPLMLAVMNGSDDIVRMLLDHNADVQPRDFHYNRDALQWAALKGYPVSTELLLAKKAKVNAVDSANHTPLYYANTHGNKEVANLLIAKGAKDKSDKSNSAESDPLKQNLKEGEAIVWYLGHCGFAIKTSSHLLIFDYFNRGALPPTPCLANGHINPAEIAGHNVYVFASHEHQDHVDPSIFGWQSQIGKVTYLFGFKPENLPAYRDSGYTGPAYEYFTPHEHRTIGDVQVTTIAANDAGVGFIVEVDGLTIYHAGDHAGWREGQREGFTNEIDYIASQIPRVDMAFLNATGCHVQDTIALAGSIQYTLDKLHPNCWFPTHGLNSEYVYRKMAAKVTAAGYKSEPVCTENRGDRYIYRNGIICKSQGLPVQFLPLRMN